MTERFPHTETVWALQLTLSEASEQLQSLHKKPKQAWEPEVNGRNREVCEEQQKCRRRRGSAERESTRERIQRAEVTSWKPSVTKLEEMFWGRSRLLELKSCFIFSSDVKWCEMMSDDVRWCEMTDRRSDSHLRWMWNRPGWLTDEQLC